MKRNNNIKKLHKINKDWVYLDIKKKKYIFKNKEYLKLNDVYESFREYLIEGRNL